MPAHRFAITEVICPPLYLMRRRSWVAFVLNSCGYLLAISSVIGAILQREVALLIGSLSVWLLCFLGIIASRRNALPTTRQAPVPRASTAQWVFEVALIISIPVLMSFGFMFGVGDGDDGGADTEAALVEAEWIVIQVDNYRRIEGHNPESLDELQRRFPEAAIDAADPWGRRWVLSPAAKGTRAETGDVWVCSRGRSGSGICAVTSSPRASAWSRGAVGYSTHSGKVVTSDYTRLADKGIDLLAVLLLIAPLPAYVGRRIIRWWRGRPTPGAGVFVAVLVLVIPSVIVVSVLSRPRIENRAAIALAQINLRTLNSAIQEYRKHVGSLPPTLTDLTRPVTNARGVTAGPFLEKIPSGPWRGGRPATYTYKRSTDGRYLLSWRDSAGRVRRSFEASER